MSETPAPMTTAGTRSRGGNAMGRTRDALLEAALVAIEKHGARRATMGDIARLANVAKGTLYNHFRSKEEVYAAAASFAVASLAVRAADVAAGDGLGAGLACAAEAVATSPVLARLRADEPAVLGAAVVAVGVEAVAAAAQVLAAGGLPGDAAAAEIVVRWLVGFAGGTGDVAVVGALSERLATALRATYVATVVAPRDSAPDGSSLAHVASAS